MINFECKNKICSFEQRYEFGEVPSNCPSCGCKWYRLRFLKEGKKKSNPLDTNWYEKDNPRWSASMGCNPDQIPMMREHHPDSVYHPETGDLLVMNRAHKKKEMRRRGLSEF